MDAGIPASSPWQPGTWSPSAAIPAGAAITGENNIPEWYSPAANRWSWYPYAIHFEHPSLPGNWYPRVTLVRGGWIFITTRHNGQCRFFDPASGDLVGPALPAPPNPYHAGWDYSVVLLPLVPGDGYRARVLAVNGAQPRQPLADTPPLPAIWSGAVFSPPGRLNRHWVAIQM